MQQIIVIGKDQPPIIPVPLEGAFRHRRRSDTRVFDGDACHGLVVWIKPDGATERVEYRYDIEVDGCVTADEFVMLKRHRAAVNRAQHPYHRATMRSPLRGDGGSPNTTPRFVDDHAAVGNTERIPEGEEPDPAPRPTRSLLDQPHRTEAVRSRIYRGPTEDGVPRGGKQSGMGSWLMRSFIA